MYFFLYLLLGILLIAFIIRLAWPILWFFLVIYLIYSFYRTIRMRQMKKKMEKQTREFEERFTREFQDSFFHQNQRYQSRSKQGDNEDIIEADFTVKEEDS